MANVANWHPAFKFGHKVYPQNLITPFTPVETGDVWFVDGDKSADGGGKTWEDAYSTIQGAIDASSAGDVIYIAGRTHTDYTGDPVSYEENLTIPYASSSLSLIGVSRGMTQGGLPQLKDGSTTTQHILRIRAPGCLIANLGFNGAGNTGGGILLDDDYSTKAAFGTTIANCHLKNCKGSTATDSRTGGAINFSSAGNSWQVRIVGNRFYKNVGDIVLPGTTNTRPQDLLIEDNHFSPIGANTDCNVYLAGGSGVNGVTINRCVFGNLPAVGSGSVVRYYDLTGCVGWVTNCTFGCDINASATELTFGTAGTGGKTPTTVQVSRCYGETTTAGESGEINTA
jgi:hypothetical protein